MKLATRAYSITLCLLMLVFAASAQTTSTQRSEKDDRNTAPTIGTGGAVGGPTGLFTVYDSSTLRKGEYTLSAAWSNYDRDPGNADIVSVPLSFQVGLTNKLELFFGTEAYRAIKVNNPQNLSSFYLPNSTLSNTGVRRTGGAIVLAPGTGSGPLGNRAIFRPVNSPNAAFPFTGANAGTFGFNFPFFSGPQFGFGAGTNATLGGPRVGGASDLFPGVGSPFGGILPGIVLQTANVTNAGGLVVGTTPTSFSAAPTYLADAPFINRTYGTTAFNSLDVGLKWRLNALNDSWGHGFVASYRWYLDTADGPAGFNQLNRGAGPGSDWGDVSLTYFIDSRVTKWANVSGNVGYTYTTKAKGNFGGTDFTIFDPGDELKYAVAVDFPVNKFFQPILEFRGLHYVGGRTPNALEQDPIDGLAGIRVFPRRWFGFSLGYRYNFNQQDLDSFEDDSTSQSVTVLCGPLSTAGCASTTATVTRTGVPPGLGVSNDPHGYLAQFFIGRRDKRAGEVINLPANVESVTLGDTVVTLPCRPGQVPRSGGACNDSKTVSVATVARDPENDVLTYNYTVSGGRIVGTGANVQWDLSTAQAGTYTITTGVDDGCGVCGRTDTKTIRIEECDCVTPEVPITCNCATFSVSGPAGTTSPGDNMTFTVNGTRGDMTYNWTVSAGEIASGQGTQSITVRTTEGMAGSNVTATVTVGGQQVNCNCQTEAQETAGVAARPTFNMIDEFGKVANDDLKARIDNLFLQLGNSPGAQGYIINYGTAAQIRQRRAVIVAHMRMRQLDASRVTFVDGPATGGDINTKLYVVPSGATPPTP